jgi:hypothetical protein
MLKMLCKINRKTIFVPRKTEQQTGIMNRSVFPKFMLTKMLLKA